jgi:hypothetical protein
MRAWEVAIGPLFGLLVLCVGVLVRMLAWSLVVVCLGIRIRVLVRDVV